MAPLSSWGCPMRFMGSLVHKRSTMAWGALAAGKRAGAEAVDANAVAGPVNGQMAIHLQDAAFQTMIGDRAGRAHTFVGIWIRCHLAVHGAE